MREYEFRGKRLDNGKWVYGSLVIDNNKYYIATQVNYHISTDKYDVYNDDYSVMMYEVDPETVGQYTGLKDKNEVKIYEGDIVICKQYIDGNWIDCCIEKGFIIFKEGEFGLHKKQGYYQSLKKFIEYNYEIEVIRRHSR